MHRDDQIEANKAVVIRFNQEVLERGIEGSYEALLAPAFVNRTAPPGVPAGPEGMAYFFEKILRPALGDLRVEIHEQVAEGDLVTTRKTIRGMHRGDFLGVPATGAAVAIDVIDMVRVRDGQYVEHWGVNTLASVIAALAAEARRGAR
jgi:predicted SnoaL-like aldol condensation-catalyzing enzyme